MGCAGAKDQEEKHPEKHLQAHHDVEEEEEEELPMPTVQPKVEPKVQSPPLIPSMQPPKLPPPPIPTKQPHKLPPPPIPTMQPPKKSNTSAPAHQPKRYCDTEYAKIKVLGRGAFGVCHLVEDPKHQKFAMKEICLAGLDLAGCDSAAQECEIMLKLQHPNIVNYIGSNMDKASETLRIVMEFADGGDLKMIKPAAGALLEEAVLLPLVVQISLALHYLHSHTIVHRDLKPANILLCRHMSGGQVHHVIKLADFGIAKVLESTQGGNTCIGTPQYMAPELYKGVAYGCSSDMWALGVVVYEMLNAFERSPFGGSNILAITNAVVNVRPPPLPAQYSDNIKQLTERLLSKQAANRPLPSDVLHAPVFSAVLLELLRLEIAKPSDLPALEQLMSPTSLSASGISAAIVKETANELARPPVPDNLSGSTQNFTKEFQTTLSNITVGCLCEVPQDGWADDEHHGKCLTCSADFGLFKRRHHCRSCGGVFCSGCSDNIFELADPQGRHPGPKRVCDECFNELEGLRREKQYDKLGVAKSTVRMGVVSVV